tara:strand:- start:45 stop:356 length:312 start_codon:yes stop_codon:yes gene_type:complete
MLYTCRRTGGNAGFRYFSAKNDYNRFCSCPTGDDRTVEVSVRDNDVDQALRALKKKMQREGIFREMKMRRSYEKPSERRAREKAEAIRRARKLERKRIEREGF